MKKLTATQQNFGKGIKAGRSAFDANNYPEEESKSLNSGSRGGSKNRQFGKSKAKKGTKGSKKVKKHARGSSDGMDSHSESDEAVDDKGAMFQKRNGPFDLNGKRKGYNGMNDNLDHSESEEGNNQDNPNFDGNDFMFKKRDAFGSSAMGKN